LRNREGTSEDYVSNRELGNRGIPRRLASAKPHDSAVHPPHRRSGSSNIRHGWRCRSARRTIEGSSLTELIFRSCILGRDARAGLHDLQTNTPRSLGGTAGGEDPGQVWLSSGPAVPSCAFPHASAETANPYTLMCRAARVRIPNCFTVDCPSLLFFLLDEFIAPGPEQKSRNKQLMLN